MNRDQVEGWGQRRGQGGKVSRGGRGVFALSALLHKVWGSALG